MTIFEGAANLSEEFQSHRCRVTSTKVPQTDLQFSEMKSFEEDEEIHEVIRAMKNHNGLS